MKSGEFTIASRKEIGEKYKNLITYTDAKITSPTKEGFIVLPFNEIENSRQYNKDFCGDLKLIDNSLYKYYYILKI